MIFDYIRYKTLLESDELKSVRDLAKDIVNFRLNQDSDILVAYTGEPGSPQVSVVLLISPPKNSKPSPVPFQPILPNGVQVRL